MTKVLITGGHHNSALVIARSLRDKGYQVVWVGHRRTMVGDPHDSFEYQEVTRHNFTFYNLIAGKFHPQAHPLHLVRLPLGFIHAFFILMRLRPNLVLAFGGYLAAPVALAAKFMGIPIIAFEQTTTIGRANQLISKLAVKNFLSWDSSLPHFPPATREVVGLPLHRYFTSKPKTKLFSTANPVILFTGGKQGSHALNQVVFKLVPQLVKKYNLIHQTGSTVATGDYTQALKLKSSLPQKFQPRYLVKPHFLAETMLDCLKTASLVISRAGAHIVYELLSLGKPAILIPIPFSYRHEQQLNALKLKQANLGTIINQDKLSPASLLRAIHHTNLRPKVTLSPPPPLDATDSIISYIISHYPHAPQPSPHQNI